MESEKERTAEKRERRLRARAKRLGLQVRKTRSQRRPDDGGCYMLLSSNGFAVAGTQFELTLDNLEEWLERCATRGEGGKP